MMSDLLSGTQGFHSAATQASSQSDLPLASGLACIIDSKSETLADATVHNWGSILWCHELCFIRTQLLLSSVTTGLAGCKTGIFEGLICCCTTQIKLQLLKYPDC